MARRAAASGTRPRRGSTPLPSPSSAARNRAWVSASGGTALSLAEHFGGDPFCPAGLRHERCERRDFVVPFNERGARADPAKGVVVEVPCGSVDGARMGIDDDLSRTGAVLVLDHETAEMHLADRLGRQAVDIG